MTLEDLEKAGYHKFGGTSGKLADFGMQRTIYEEGDRKAYFITIYCYDRSGYPDVKHWPDRYRWGFQPEVHFYLDDEGRGAFIVTMLTEDSTRLEEMEGFFARIYQQMACVPDAHNN